MADDIPTNLGTNPGNVPVRTDDVGGVQYQIIKMDVGGNGVSVPVVGTMPVSGTVATGGLTDGELRAAPVTIDTAQLPAALVGGRLDENVGAWLGSTAPTVGSKTSPNSIPVVIASDQAAITVSPSTSAASARTSVAAAAADTLILASNAARKGAMVYNDSVSATLYLGLGTTAASLTSFTSALVPGAYYEVPFSFTGQLRGIWSAAVGNARVSEVT